MKDKKATTDDDLIAEINDFKSDSEGYWGEIHNQYTQDVKFSRMGEQWDDRTARARKADGKPVLTFNKIPSFMRQVTNESRMNKPAIVVKPVDSGADVDTALILNGMIRSIESASNSDYAYDTAIDNTVAGGLGYIFVTTDYADDMTFEQDIMLKRCVNPLTVKFDPMSIEPDGSDQMACLIEDKIRESTYKQLYPDSDCDNAEWKGDDGISVCQYWKVTLVDDELLLLSDGSAIKKSDYEVDPEIALVYEQMGIQLTEKSRPIKRRKVFQYITNGSEILKKTEWAGQYIPVVPVYGEEVWDGEKRYYKSIHRDAQDAQRMYNYFRTASTESVALQVRTPYLGKVGTFDTDASKWATINTANHAYVEYDNETPQRQGWTGVDQGSLQEAMNASDDMKGIMGIFDASLGARSNETSGVAIAQRKSQAGVATYHFADNLARSIRQVGRIIVDLIPKVYDTPRMVRIIGEDNKTEEMVEINVETVRNGRAAMFDVKSGKYDVVVDTGASFSTRREETAAQINDAMRAYPPGAPILMDVLAENSDWPKADKIAKRFAAMLPPEIQGLEEDVEADPQQLMMENQRLQQQIQQAEEAIQHFQGQLQEQEQQAQQSESAIQLALEQEKNKGKYLDLQKQEQVTKQKQADLLANQSPFLPNGGELTY